MKKQVKIGFLAVFLILRISAAGFTQNFPSLDELQKNVNDFSGELAKSLPLNSSLGLNWSYAYIGKILPSIPPHFGFGGSFGVTTMDLKAINKLMGNFGYTVPFNVSKLALPAYTAEARIGGIFLPFDIGVKFGYLPSLEIWGEKTKFDYLLAGGDLRYNLADLKLFKFSLGLGVNYMKGSIGGKVGSEQTIEYGSETIAIESPDVNLHWKTTYLDFKAQASFHFAIFTPYIGLGAGYGWSSAGYSVNADINGDLDGIINYAKSRGLAGIYISESGMSSTVKNGAFSIRAFGGLSLNMAMFRIDLTALYSFIDQNYGGSVGLRFQL